MAKIISLAGVATAVNVQVQQKTAKLQFFLKTADANAADWPTLQAWLAAIKLDVSLQKRTGSTETLIPPLGLDKVAQHYSANEGVIEVIDNGVTHDVRFSVEIGTTGAVNLDKDTTLVLNITGTHALDVLDVYAVDFPIETNSVIKTNVIGVKANAAQEIGLQDSSILHLPVTTFDNIELRYPGGKVVKLVFEELAGWCIEGNQSIFNRDGVTIDGYLDFFSINVADSVSAKVTQTADTTIYLHTWLAVV